MKKGLLAVLLLVLAGLVWWGGQRDQGPVRSEAQDESIRAYPFEAQDAVVRQMDAEGQLQFEVEAQRIVQLPEGGGLLASDLTLYHDPKGTPAGSPQRWTLKAREGRLPNDGIELRLSSNVTARGLPAGSRSPLQFATEELRYDLEAQMAFTDGKVEFTHGKNRLAGRGLSVNIATGEYRLELVTHAKISL